MVNYKKLTINNYKTIGSAEILFEAGLYKVRGINNDDKYISNGAGKSTFLQALILCLYNRDLTGVNLDHLNNRTSKKPYSIILELTNTKNSESTDYTIINDRSLPKKMQITSGDDVIAVGVTNCLPVIEEILGVGFETFKVTHYITSRTVTELTQNLSQPTLFNDILHVVELQEIDKVLREVSKELEVSIIETRKNLKDAEEYEKILLLSNRFDKDSLEETLSVTKDELSMLEARYQELSVQLKDDVVEHQNIIAKLEQTIHQTKTSMKSGICSMCGTTLLNQEVLVAMAKQLEDANSQLLQTQSMYSKVSGKLSILTKKYLDAKDELTISINKLQQDLGIASEISNLELIPKEKGGLKETLTDYEQQLAFTASARKEIKSGKVVQNILDKFFGVVQYKIKHYSELINLEQFDIVVGNDKLGMCITIQQDKVQIPIDSLSNGEKTRLSLLILISLLDAMKAITESDDNFLSIDEASSSLDASGAQEMQRLFSYLKGLGQSIFIITHGKELDLINYDYEVVVEKTGGLSSVMIGEA